jgi:amidase
MKSAGELIIDREVATPGEQEGADELTVLLAELGDDLTAYLAARPGDGVKSLDDVIQYEDANADIEQPHFGHEFFTMAVAAGGRATAEYQEARARNLTWAIDSCLTPALADADVLLAPAYGPAWKSDLTISGHATALSSGSTMPAAVAGWPIASVPIGLVDGLPVGVTILGRAHDEWTILAAARRIEAVVNATTQLPRATFQPPQRG